MANPHNLNHSHYLVKPGTKVKLSKLNPQFTAGIKDKKEAAEALLDDVSTLSSQQELLWASQSHSVLIIIQAIDAAGKDSTIKHVMSGVNPQGCSVTSFKAPSSEELQHHYLWRPQKFLPARGQIAIFNRSYYEEVIVVKVHPNFLIPQGINPGALNKNFWKTRYEEINKFENALTRNGTVVLKFFLNVSKEEQRERFISRLKDPLKLWKFSANDLKESEHWDEYQRCYEEMLSNTSTKEAPWYIIPADKKWFTRACVADIITAQIKKLNLSLPEVSKETQKQLKITLSQLEQEQSVGKKKRD